MKVEAYKLTDTESVEIVPVKSEETMSGYRIAE